MKYHNLKKKHEHKTKEYEMTIKNLNNEILELQTINKSLEVKTNEVNSKAEQAIADNQRLAEKLESARNRYKDNLETVKMNFETKLSKVESDKASLKEIVKDLEFHNR